MMPRDPSNTEKRIVQKLVIFFNLTLGWGHPQIFFWECMTIGEIFDQISSKWSQNHRKPSRKHVG